MAYSSQRETHNDDDNDNNNNNNNNNNNIQLEFGVDKCVRKNIGKDKPKETENISLDNNLGVWNRENFVVFGGRRKFVIKHEMIPKETESAETFRQK